MASLSGVACGDDDGGTTAATTTDADGDATTTTGPGPTGPTTGPTTGMQTTGETTGPTTGEATGPTTGEATGTAGGPMDDTAGETGETTGAVGAALPATHRFGCLDIVELGDSNADGVPDGNAIQALLLENTWMSDIRAYRLNVMLTLQSNDPAAGMAELALASGIGPSADQLCAEPTTVAPMLPATFDPALVAWQPVQTPGACAEPATAGAAGGGTYTLVLGPEQPIYIYAQESDGTTLNCVAGGGAPNAVPLRAIRATLTLDADGEVASGELTGCLLATEAAGLCSCLSDCQGMGHPDCAACPNGSVPLSALLGGVGPTDNCTTVMGDTAYDLRVRFSGERLAIDEPMVCGGA